jgi:leucyl aminopeptidase (aminopeptidase T)
MMKVIKQTAVARKPGKSNALEQKIAQAVFEQCFALKRYESVLVLADKKKLDVGNMLFSAAATLTDQLNMIVFDGMTENGQEPCTEVADSLMLADVSVLVTDFSLSHTKARVRASQNGARIASLPGITLPMMKRTMNIDYTAIKRESEKFAEMLTNASKVTITSPAGTHLTMSLIGRAGIADTGELTQLGAFGNLPAGEAFIAPVEGTANGVLVVDGSLADIALDGSVRIEIKHGLAVKIEGGRAATSFENAMNAVGPKSRVVAEFGIGTNPKAIVQPDVLEAEKAAGTVHVAFGLNADFGGTNEVEFHTDGVILQPKFVLE